MQERKCNTKAIKEAIRKKVYEPCNQVRQCITKKEMPESALLGDQARTQVNELLSMYAVEYRFRKDSIFYDVAANPENHFKAFFKIAELSETNQMKAFACFPIRTTFIPSYMTLDSKILNLHIIKSKKVLKANQKFESWNQVVNMEKKVFKQQGYMKSLRFQGTLETDGVGVSILKQNTDTSRNSTKTKKTTKVDDDETKHIEKLSQADLKNTVGRCVLIDPGRRDIMYCMKESSSVEEKQKLIFTKNNRTKRSRHFRSLRKRNMPSVVQEAESVFSRFESKSVNLEKFIKYTKARSSVEKILYEYYGNETAKPTRTYYPGYDFDFHIDQRGNLYYGSLFVVRIRGFYPQPENKSDDIALKSQTYANYIQIMLLQRHILERLTDRIRYEVQRLAQAIYEQPQENGHKAKISTLLEKLHLLPFRKMKFSSYVYYQQNDLKLVRGLKAKFGDNAILIFGDWSAPNTKYQEPTRNKGLIRMLKKNGFVVYLTDEYKTSTFCPTCESKLEKFKLVKNPRPYRQKENPTVMCHGLLR